MDNKLMESYLDRIGELVIDEDKIVTYKSLSRILGIHINTAKQLLYTYLSRQKTVTSDAISATYLLAGKLADGSFNITILNETDLKSNYSKFIEITSEHVYSIQKGKNVKEIKVLCGIDKEVPNVDSSVIIKCSKSILKTKGNNDKKIDNSAEGSTTKNQNQTKSVVEKDKKTVDVKSESPVKKIPNKTSPIDNKSKVNKEKGKGNTKQQKGNIATFFANAGQKNSDKSKNILKNKNNSPVNNENKSSVVTEKVVVEKDEKNKVESQFKENVKKKKGTNKRKRIQMISDSEESNSDSDNEEPPPVEEDEIPEPLPVSVMLEEEEEEITNLPRNKRKKRKIVDKTVMTEDGYIETKKEVVFQTDSEDEVDDKAASSKKEGSEQEKCKLEVISEKTKTSTSKTLKKQSSLLTFFKKN